MVWAALLLTVLRVGGTAVLRSVGPRPRAQYRAPTVAGRNPPRRVLACGGSPRLLHEAMRAAGMLPAARASSDGVAVPPPDGDAATSHALAHL